ncbi:uncharacterized protein LOC142349370 [Convolutriloba macropyga]|uniref:uncharacterized protein LOC142349370 n=1 Tax=Convolutriloba macropyga TaxID=536237 RepID=UPI003F5207B6
MDQVFIVKVVGLTSAVASFAFTLLANMKDWFSVPGGLRSPIFSLWHVCFDDNLQECTDPITESQYGYNPALYTARFFFILACILLTILVILCIGGVLNSVKVESTSLVLPIFAGLAFLCLLLACPIMEGGVRLQVTRFLTITGQPRIDSVFGWAGICAWVAFILNLVNIGVMGAVFSMVNGEYERAGSDV